jgi:hypothetical protein
MGFLRRAFGGGDPPPPDWAQFFSASEYARFLKTVESDLRRRGLDYSVAAEFVTVQDPNGGPENQLGLINLAQKCLAAPQSEWQTIVAGHIGSLIQMQGRDLDALAADFEQARRVLRLRIFPDETTGGIAAPGVPDGPVLRPVAPGMVLGLVFDFPDSTATVSERHLRSWPLSEAEVLAVAREETLAEPLPPSQTIQAQENVPIEMLAGDSFYVASRVLGLRGVIGDAPNGAVVAVPNRHVLLYHVIRDLRVVHAVQAMISLTIRFYHEGPGSVSHQLYWWKDGDLLHLPVRAEGKDVQFHPPDEFVVVLNGLTDGDRR